MLTPYEKEILIEGIRLYAWWKDGVQYVGNSGRTLAQAIEDIAPNRDEPFVNPKYREEIRDSIENITGYVGYFSPPVVSSSVNKLKSLLL